MLRTTPGSPRVGEEELERREVAWEDEPRGYWGDHMLEEQGIEMQALGADVEAPFGANMSRVMQVGKKFAPKVVARMEQMGEAAIKKMGWSLPCQSGHVGDRTRRWRHHRNRHADAR